MLIKVFIWLGIWVGQTHALRPPKKKKYTCLAGHFLINELPLYIYVKERGPKLTFQNWRKQVLFLKVIFKHNSTFCNDLSKRAQNIHWYCHALASNQTV